MTIDEATSWMNKDALVAVYKDAPDAVEVFHAGGTGSSDYERGLNDAWEAAQDLFSAKFLDTELEELFGTRDPAEVLLGNDVSEAVEKIKAREESKDKEIHVGDVVKHKYKDICGTILAKRNGYCMVLWQDGGTAGYPADDVFTKTGRTMDVEGFLKQIGGTDEADAR